MKSKEFFSNKIVSSVTFILFIFILLAVLFSLSSIVYADIMTKYAFEQSVLKTARLNSSSVFYLDKILIFSSADAYQNEVNNKAIWNINVSQFSDIAIYIKNEGTLTHENTIQSLYIDNIKYNKTPELGTPNLFYKNVNNFGKYEFIENNVITETLNYEIVTENINYETPQLYPDTSSPICLSYINRDIKNNHIISDISEPLTYNGSLLKRSNISLNSIATTISFNINIINNLNHHFICNVNLEIPLKDDNSSIYDGTYTRESTNFSMYSFYRIK